jgi:hypothetical protein
VVAAPDYDRKMNQTAIGAFIGSMSEIIRANE